MIILGTCLSAMLIIKLIAGKKYDEVCESLVGDQYPLSEIYGVGFAWSEKTIKLQGTMREKLVSEAKLLYDPKYADYYANVTWAQSITIVHFTLCVAIIAGAIMDSAFIAIAGVGVAGFFGYYFVNSQSEKLKERENNCVIELPEVVSTMALLVNSGMVLRQAWSTVAYSKEGDIYTLMRNACIDMENGFSEIDAIYKFGVLSGSTEVKKFASTLVQGAEKGSRELGDLLAKQSSEMWELKKQVMLQKGEKTATSLLIPTVIIFVGIILVVVAGAIGMLI